MKVREVEVAPAMLAKAPPPGGLDCHCAVGVGEPVAAAVKVTGEPAATLCDVGLLVIAGPAETVNVKLCVAFGDTPLAAVIVSG